MQVACGLADRPVWGPGRSGSWPPRAARQAEGTRSAIPARTAVPVEARRRRPPSARTEEIEIGETTTTSAGRGEDAPARFREARVEHWDRIARGGRPAARLSAYYHQRLTRIYQFLVPPGQRVIELGCGGGDLLAALKPALGIGVDFSEQMLRVARERHPELRLVRADVHELELSETFDTVILSDLVHDLWDIQTVLERASALCTPQTRIILNFYSRVWQMPLALAEGLHLARPTLDRNWVTPDDVANLLHLTDFEAMRNWTEILCPLRIPGLNWLCDRVLVKIWPLRLVAMTNFVVARPMLGGDRRVAEPTVSVIVPARNEEGNVPDIFDRTPEMAGGTEIVFVEGGSSDDTYEAARRAIADRPDLRCKLLRQTGRGKGDAVRLGFAEASGDIVLILDADLTVAPEDLPRFVEALRNGRGEFVNGVRLVYPMEKRSMRFCNFLANKFFSLAFSWLLGQPVKDTLCGTKALWREDYERIATHRGYFGDFDPYGDYDLIFGAAKLNLKMVDMPIRYRERTYGRTNINPWSGGLLLLRMAALAAWRLKFV